MKKLTLIFLTLALLSLCACGGTEPDNVQNMDIPPVTDNQTSVPEQDDASADQEIGRASCRERV